MKKMENLKKSSEHCGRKENLNIWHCEKCHSFHFSVGEILLTFSPQEFLDLSAIIGELYGKANLELLKQEQKYFELGLVS